MAKWCKKWGHQRPWYWPCSFMGPIWGPPGSCRPQTGPMLAPWTLISGSVSTPEGLTHRGWVTQICISRPGHHCFKKWFVACSAPNHYLDQCSPVVDWTLGNKFYWNLYQNTTVFTPETAFQNVSLTRWPPLSVSLKVWTFLLLLFL